MNNNNNNKKGQNGSKKLAAQMASLVNEVNQLKAKAGSNAKPSNNRRKAKKSGNKSASTGEGSIRQTTGYGNKASMPILESEYIAEIAPTAFPAFSVQTFPVNPGQVATFPWLARIAQNFEKYEFESLEFVYKREVSEFAPNGVTGKVIMSFDADASDAPPTTKQQMEDTVPHSDCMPCENMRLRVPRAMLQRLNDAHYVRSGPQPANTDLKTYDVGNLYVACQGTAANTVVGELHVEYALRLRIPVLEGPGIVLGGYVAGGGALTAGNPFGTVPVVDAQSDGIAMSAASVLSFSQPGTYIIAATYVGTGITAIAAPTLSAGAALVSQGGTINGTAVQASYSGAYVISVAGATLTFAATATTITASSIRVGNVPAGSQN